MPPHMQTNVHLERHVHFAPTKRTVTDFKKLKQATVFFQPVMRQCCGDRYSYARLQKIWILSLIGSLQGTAAYVIL